jgi:hypothetical protein
MTLKLLFLLTLFGSCGYAVIAGRTAGRLTAVLLTSAALLTPILYGAVSWESTLVVGMAIDILLFLGLCILSMSFNRWWLIWCAGLQLASVTTHLSTIISPVFVPIVYQAIAEFWSAPILLAMAIGIALDNRAERLA